MADYLKPIEILSKYENIAINYNLTAQSLGWLVRMKIIKGISSKNCYLISERSFVATFKMLINRDQAILQKVNSDV